MEKHDTALLEQLIREEFMNIPIMKWGYFFPCTIAIWRYIEERWPGTLGEVHASYRDEPVFEGWSAEWFCAVLLNNTVILDTLESIMYPAIHFVKGPAVERGFVKLESEIPPVSAADLNQLITEIIREVESALSNGTLSRH